MPNLVQTLENNPAFVHGGPFANIAHGCNSVMATKTALKLADYVVTEAGFGADLGAEKFFDIKCRKAGLTPAAAVIVATVRALKMHGGVAKDDLGKENVEALQEGPRQSRPPHRERQASSACRSVVAINHFTTDTEAELAAIQEFCAAQSASRRSLCTHWAEGGEGHRGAGQHVVGQVADSGAPQFTAALSATTCRSGDKIKTIATRNLPRRRRRRRHSGARPARANGKRRAIGKFPVCMAKTQYSFSTDPEPQGRADPSCGADPRGAPVGRGRVHRGDLRRHHDHAGPAQGPLGRSHRPRREGPGRGVVLRSGE